MLTSMVGLKALQGSQNFVISACTKAGVTSPYTSTPTLPHSTASHLQPGVQLYLVHRRLDRRRFGQLLQVRDAKVADPNGPDEALRGGGWQECNQWVLPACDAPTRARQPLEQRACACCGSKGAWGSQATLHCTTRSFMAYPSTPASSPAAWCTHLHPCLLAT